MSSLENQQNKINILFYYSMHKYSSITARFKHPNVTQVRRVSPTPPLAIEALLDAPKATVSKGSSNQQPFGQILELRLSLRIREWINLRSDRL